VVVYGQVPVCRAGPNFWFKKYNGRLEGTGQEILKNEEVKHAYLGE